MITLPCIDKGVPPSYTFRVSGDNRIARLALILEDLGVLTEADDAVRASAKKPWPHESEMVESAIARWAAQTTGELAVFSDVALAVATTVDQYLDHFRYTGEEPPDVDPDHAVMFVLIPWDIGDCWVMQERCTAIERAVPGLVQSALHAIHDATHCSVQSLLPACALEFGEMMYGWGMEQDDSEDSRINLKSFTDSFPRWVVTPRRKLARPRVAELARGNEVAAALRDLDVALADRRALRPACCSGWRASFGLVLRWSEHDPMPQIADDWRDDCHNGGEGTDDYSQHAVPLTVPAVRDFLDRFGRMLRIIACTDRLVSLIAEKQ